MRKLLHVILVLLGGISVANAHPRHYVSAPNVAVGLGYGLVHMLNSVGPRPRLWCGWYMRSIYGVSDPSYNLAINWAHYGRPAMGPGVGVIVVWPWHVGRIVGGSPGHWVVESGNYNNRVATVEMSLRGVVAYREP